MPSSVEASEGRSFKEHLYVMERMQDGLNLTIKWVEEERLNISPNKSTIIAFTQILKLEGIGPLSLRGENIQISRVILHILE